eukprot:922892-Amphidinium_carterae.1
MVAGEGVDQRLTAVETKVHGTLMAIQGPMMVRGLCVDKAEFLIECGGDREYEHRQTQLAATARSASGLPNPTIRSGGVGRTKHWAERACAWNTV